MSKQNTKDALHDLKESEIRGEINRMPEMPQMPEAPKPAETTVVSRPGDFLFAISRAKLEKKPYIEVTKDILEYIMNGHPGTSIMFQGMRVFLEGTAKQTLKEEAMSAEEYGDMVNKRRHQEFHKQA